MGFPRRDRRTDAARLAVSTMAWHSAGSDVTKIVPQAVERRIRACPTGASAASPLRVRRDAWPQRFHDLAYPRAPAHRIRAFRLAAKRPEASCAIGDALRNPHPRIDGFRSGLRRAPARARPLTAFRGAAQRNAGTAPKGNPPCLRKTGPGDDTSSGRECSTRPAPGKCGQSPDDAPTFAAGSRPDRVPPHGLSSGGRRANRTCPRPFKPRHRSTEPATRFRNESRTSRDARGRSSMRQTPAGRADHSAPATHRADRPGGTEMKAMMTGTDGTTSRDQTRKARSAVGIALILALSLWLPPGAVQGQVVYNQTTKLIGNLGINRGTVSSIDQDRIHSQAFQARRQQQRRIHPRKHHLGCAHADNTSTAPRVELYSTARPQ